MTTGEHNVVTFKADAETRRLLDLLQESEERTRSDVIRRAIRFHAEQVGLVKPKKPVKSRAGKGKP